MGPWKVGAKAHRKFVLSAVVVVISHVALANHGGDGLFVPGKLEPCTLKSLLVKHVDESWILAFLKESEFCFGNCHHSSSNQIKSDHFVYY